MTLNSLLMQLQAVFTAMQDSAPPALMIIAGLWGLQLINHLLRYRLNHLGLVPRHVSGVAGIIFSPMLHGSFTHLFFNSIPLFVLLSFILMNSLQDFIEVTLMIIIFSGIATWLFGRRGIHIGASGLIMGYWGYLLVDAIQHPSVKTIILSLICMYYFGGLFFSLFPHEENVSWEGHLFGFLAGLLTAYVPIAMFY